MVGQLTHEIDINVPANKAWELYGSLKLAKLAEEKLSGAIEKIELVEGDGGVGTVLKLVFKPDLGIPVYPGYKEKFTKVDNENHIKEAEVIEGGYLDLGFSLYRVRFDISEKEGDESCSIKTTVEYDIKEGAAPDTSKIVSIETLATLAEVAKEHLLNNKV